jgi:SAM-dependent methyltransferase
LHHDGQHGAAVSTREHWEAVWSRGPVEDAGWHQAVPRVSLELVDDLGLAPDDPIVDVGGGASSLATRLVDLGHHDVTVLDVSPAAISQGQARAPRADAITWLVGDVLDGLDRSVALWHDRAVFHFLHGDAPERYVESLRDATVVGSWAIIATFGPKAPPVCSGLPVTRYDPAALSRAIGATFDATRFEVDHHTTPAGVVQEFVYGLFRRV